MSLFFLEKVLSKAKLFVQAGKLDQILLPIHFRPGYIYIKPPFPPVIRTEKEHSLTTGLCLHWKRWQYLKKGKHLGPECEFSLCSTSMRAEWWYLSLCRTACPHGGSCAALSLRPASPTCVSVACPKPLASCEQRKNMHT